MSKLLTGDENKALIFIREIADAQRLAHNNKEPATILFSDLCDSTSYKFERGQLQGLAKSYVHNEAVMKAVEKYGGEVVKYIGDEVMAVFRGEKGCCNAITAAIEVHSALSKYNDDQELKGIDRIFTKTGINYGDVWYFKFEGHDIQDPQGTAVDCAARLTSLAKPSQILCSNVVRTKCNELFKFGNTFPRKLKGIKEPIQIHEVFSASNPSLGVTEVTHEPLKNDEITKLLTDAKHSLDYGNYDESIKHYANILARDPEHYIANAMIARIYLRHKNDMIQAHSYAEKAMASNPSAPLAKQIHAVSRWYIAEENSESTKTPIELAELESIIAQTQEALLAAENNLDFSVERWCRNDLAHFLAKKYELNQSTQNEKQTKNILKTAIEICQGLERSFDRDTFYTAAFYETYAYILSHENRKNSLETALELARKSEQLAPDSPYPLMTKANILKKLSYLAKER